MLGDGMTESNTELDTHRRFVVVIRQSSRNRAEGEIDPGEIIRADQLMQPVEAALKCGVIRPLEDGAEFPAETEPPREE